MSRCFPFPPPGYERKARTDEVDLLKKEKHKEKKHKKEKKDKEKREGNEKRERERSNEKHREKADKKEKHRDKDKRRDKDKDKDKDKAKDKGNASDEKRVSAQTENHTGEKVIPSEGKYKNNRNDKKSPYIVDKRSPGLFQGYKTDKISQNNHCDEEIKLVHELGRRIKDDARGTGRPIENFTLLDQKKDEGMVRLLAKGTGGMAEVTEKNKSKKVQDRAVDGMGIRDDTSTRGNETVQVGVVQINESGTRTLDKHVFRMMEGKQKEEATDKPGDKKKDKEKKSHGKDKDRDKKGKEKAKEKLQVRNIDPDKVGEKNKVSANSFKTAQLPKDSNKVCDTGGNHKKRKDLEINGVLHANDFRPTKLPRPAPPPPIENGRVLESCQTSIFHASDTQQGAANNFKVENKGRERNGTIEAQKSSLPLMKLKPPKPQVDPAESSTRPPHPDSKYLSQIYVVPNMQELSDFDDQEWLFSRNDSEHKKPVIEDSPQVWAEALQIGSADVCALPYVIPY